MTTTPEASPDSVVEGLKALARWADNAANYSLQINALRFALRGDDEAMRRSLNLMDRATLEETAAAVLKLHVAITTRLTIPNAN